MIVNGSSMPYLPPEPMEPDPRPVPEPHLDPETKQDSKPDLEPLPRLGGSEPFNWADDVEESLAN